MKILGIDYGRKKIGLAIADGPLAEPYKILRYKDPPAGEREKIKKIVKELAIEKIVVGVSEGTMADESHNFGEKLKKTCSIPVFFQDETLSTQEAQRLSRQAGIKRKKRKEMEDAFAAAIMLQSYLDQNV